MEGTTHSISQHQITYSLYSTLPATSQYLGWSFKLQTCWRYVLIKPIDRVFSFQETSYKTSQSSPTMGGKSVFIVGNVYLTAALPVYFQIGLYCTIAPCLIIMTLFSEELVDYVPSFTFFVYTHLQFCAKTRFLSGVWVVTWKNARIRLSMQRKLKSSGMNLVAAKPC